MSDQIPPEPQSSFADTQAQAQTETEAQTQAQTQAQTVHPFGGQPFGHTQQPPQFSQFQFGQTQEVPNPQGFQFGQTQSQQDTHDQQPQHYQQFQQPQQPQQEYSQASQATEQAHDTGNHTDNAHGHPTLQHMEQEAAKLRDLNSELDSIQQTPAVEVDAQRAEADSKSVYVGNVDYGATPLELQQHFSASGVVERVTIMTNKQTGQPKGFAYLEFASTDGANKAVATLDGSSFRDRELKVSLKRTNVPGLSGSSRGGIRGRGRGRGMMRGRARGGFRGRGGARGGARFSPY